MGVDINHNLHSLDWSFTIDVHTPANERTAANNAALKTVNQISFPESTLIPRWIFPFGQVSMHFWHWKQSPSTRIESSSGSPMPDGHFLVHAWQPLIQFSRLRCNAKYGSTGSSENTAPIGQRFRQKNRSSKHIPTRITSNRASPTR